MRRIVHANMVSRISLFPRRVFPISGPKIQLHTQVRPPESFFKVVGQQTSSSALSFLQNKHTFCDALTRLGVYTPQNYLFSHFVTWVNRYAVASPVYLQNYFSGQVSLNDVCNDFIKFCFRHGISLNKEQTLGCFQYHNEISDTAIKKELGRIGSREVVNLLGFGLGDGGYEKTIANHLLREGLGRKVRVFGFDPYAEKNEDIELLTEHQLLAKETPRFDVIIARWVLHHVRASQRWDNLVRCINHSNPGAMTLIIEHGFLKENRSGIDDKFYHLLNATFDVVANVGIRPEWFTHDPNNIGANFFIDYLRPRDFQAIREQATVIDEQNIRDVGPEFPHQTICRMQNSH